MIDRQLNILILEDNPYDLELVQRELNRGGLMIRCAHADTRVKFEAALDNKVTPPDIVLADYKLPGFNGRVALNIALEKRPDIPFIIVSGEIGEESAVDIVKDGATDYVLKDRLSRLVPSVKRALQEAEDRRERRRAEEQLRRSYQELEYRVEERTRELSETNEALRREIEQRIRAEDALRELPNKILQAQENERKRVAYELHDAVNQVLAGVKFRIQLLEKAILNKNYKKGDMDELMNLVGSVIQDLRRISQDLRPSALDDLGLNSVLNNLCREFQERTGIPIEFTCSNQIERLPGAIELVLYRSVQEGLINIERHAEATAVKLDLTHRRKSVVVTLSDDGKGFDIAADAAHPDSHGIGLTAMRERITAVNGTLDLTSAPGKGTTLTVAIPLGD